MSEDNTVTQVETPAGTNAEIHEPADIAAAFFKMEKPKLERLLSNMSAKQMRRFVMYVAAYPLENSSTPRTEDEKSAAYLFDQMVFNKNIMILQAEVLKAEQAQIELDASESKTEEIQGEQTNG